MFQPGGAAAGAADGATAGAGAAATGKPQLEEVFKQYGTVAQSWFEQGGGRKVINEFMTKLPTSSGAELPDVGKFINSLSSKEGEGVSTEAAVLGDIVNKISEKCDNPAVQIKIITAILNKLNKWKPSRLNLIATLIKRKLRRILQQKLDELKKTSGETANAEVADGKTANAEVVAGGEAANAEVVADGKTANAEVAGDKTQ